MEAETGVMQPQAKKHLELPEAGKGKEGFSPLELSDFRHALGELSPRLQPSILCGILPYQPTCLHWEKGGEQMPTFLRPQIGRVDHEE